MIPRKAAGMLPEIQLTENLHKQRLHCSCLIESHTEMLPELNVRIMILKTQRRLCGFCPGTVNTKGGSAQVGTPLNVGASLGDCEGIYLRACGDGQPYIVQLMQGECACHNIATHAVQLT